MTEILLIRDETGAWRPAEEISWDRSRKFPIGVSCIADIKDPSRRSGKLHRFWFALAGELFKSQEKHTNFDHFRSLMLIYMGYCDTYPQPDGKFQSIAHSLKFGKMTNDEFKALVESTLDFAVSLGWDRDELLAKTDEGRMYQEMDT